MSRHVVVDHASVLAGLRRRTPAGAPAPRLRVPDLLALLEGGDEAGTRAFATIEGELDEPRLAEIRDLGYDTYVVAAPPGVIAPDSVGTLTHGIVAHAILDAPDDDRHVLVLCGDGVADDGYGTSLPTQVRRALSWGWAVEVWSWSRVAPPEYLEVADEGRDVAWRCLADHAATVTEAAPVADDPSAADGVPGTDGASPRERRDDDDDGDGRRRRVPDQGDVATPGAEQPWV